MNEKLSINIKYHDAAYGEVKRLEKITKGNWIDVYSATDMVIPSIFDNNEYIKDTLKEIERIETFIFRLNDMIERGLTLATDMHEELISVCEKDIAYHKEQVAIFKRPSLIPLGFSLELPKGYEGRLAPRSSTFKSFGLIQTNSLGIIDTSYCGDADEWKIPVISLYNTVEIKKGDKIAQIRISQTMPSITFNEVSTLNNEDRGGFGSTGKK